MRSRFALFCFATAVPVLALSQTHIHSKIYISGTAVGENVYDRLADGSFSSNSSIDLGSIKLSGTVAGHYKGALLLDAAADTKGPRSSKVTFAKGKVEVIAGTSKPVSAPWKDTTGALVGNIHPQFTASTLAIAEKQLKANPALKETTVNAYMVDAGAVLPLKITLLQPKSV